MTALRKELGTAARPSRPEIAAGGAGASSVFRQFCERLDHASYAIAIAGSILNAIQSGARLEVDFEGLARFLPTEPLVSRGMAKRLFNDCADRKLFDEIFQSSSRFQTCLELTRGHASHAFGSKLGAAPVALAWRKLAESCLHLDEKLRQAIAAAGDYPPAAPQYPFHRLLREVAASRWPCVDARGAIVIPGWCERSTGTRKALARTPVDICWRGAWHAAELHDHCEGGLGLTGGPPDLNVGSAVFIQFDGAISIMCIVRWTSGQRFGVSLNPALQGSLLGNLLSESSGNSDHKRHAQ